MSGVTDMITGKSARRQAALAEAAQATQTKQVNDEKARLDKIVAGQAANAQTGGGGLLAYVDRQLRQKLGGEGAA